MNDDTQLPSKEYLESLTANERRKLMYAYGERSIAAYTRLMMRDFERARHHDEYFKLCHRIESGEVDRAIICVPPRHSKSLVFTQMFPSWCIGKHPDWQVILGSYGQKLADSFGRRVRNHLSDPIHQAIFPGCQLAQDSKSVQNFSTTRGGVCRAVGRGGSITGHGGHLIIIDDPIKDRAEANSEVIRDGLKEWFDEVVYTRLMPNARILIIMTRWHEDDLVGYVLREHAGDGWQHFRMPAIAEEDEGWRKKGEALWPDWFPVSRPPGETGNSLERFRATLGSRGFNCLYQQRPAGIEGGMFKYEWLDDSQYANVPTGTLNKIILVDPATSKDKSRDFTAIVCLGLAANRHVYVLDMVRDRMDMVQRKRAVWQMVAEWRPYMVGIEEYASRTDSEYWKDCMAREAFHFRMKSLGGNKLKKRERVERLVPWFEDRRIHLPKSMWRTRLDGEDADLVEEFRNEEYGVFPAGAHDDVIDAMSRFCDEEVSLQWPLEDEYQERRAWDGNQERPSGGGSWMTV